MPQVCGLSLSWVVGGFASSPVSRLQDGPSQCCTVALACLLLVGSWYWLVPCCAIKAAHYRPCSPYPALWGCNPWWVPTCVGRPWHLACALSCVAALHISLAGCCFFPTFVQLMFAWCLPFSLWGLLCWHFPGFFSSEISALIILAEIWAFWQWERDKNKAVVLLLCVDPSTI